MDGRPLQRRTWVALALLTLIYVWIWAVSAHRIDGQPFSGFAQVFITGCGDFEHFYHAARAMRDGTPLYSSGVHGYIYPPLIAFLFGQRLQFLKIDAGKRPAHLFLSLDDPFVDLLLPSVIESEFFLNLRHAEQHGIVDSGTKSAPHWSTPFLGISHQHEHRAQNNTRRQTTPPHRMSLST